MTALDRYAKLEAVGRYHDGAAAPREVVVSFGERSLIIMSLDDAPIAHWPLASLRATGIPARLPVEIAPHRTADERLVLDDGEMSAAIAEVCPDLHSAAAAPRRRALWRALAAALALALLAAAGTALWPMLPDSLADLVPPAREAALGDALAARAPALVDAAAPPGLCIGDEGLAALGLLAERLAPGPDRPLRLSVLDHPGRDALALPGGRLILLRGLIDAARAPEEVAGIVAHAIGHARARDPLRAIIGRAGPLALAGLLLGDVTAERVLADAAAAVAGAAYPPDAEATADASAFARLTGAGLPVLPYAGLAARLAERLAAADPPAGYAARHPWARARAAAAAAADTVGGAPFAPALRDRDWLALGTICDRTRPAEPARF